MVSEFTWYYSLIGIIPREDVSRLAGERRHPLELPYYHISGITQALHLWYYSSITLVVLLKHYTSGITQKSYTSGMYYIYTGLYHNSVSYSATPGHAPVQQFAAGKQLPQLRKQIDNAWRMVGLDGDCIYRGRRGLGQHLYRHIAKHLRELRPRHGYLTVMWWT